MSNIKKLLIVTDEDIAQTRAHYQKSETDIKQDVAILKQWLKQQPHLPDDEDEWCLERMLLRNKCRLVQTKIKLDKWYSFKNIYPEMLDMYDITSARVQNARNICVPLPQLTDKQERVTMYKIVNADTYQGLDASLYLLMMVELIHTYDYSSSNIILIDWEGHELKSLKTIEPNLIHKFFAICSEALSSRFTRIHFISPSTLIDIFLQLAKTVLKPKLFAKIHSSSTIYGIYDIVPKKMLPIEYGGEEKSIYELREEWDNELQFQKDVLKQMSKRVSNEQLRPEQLEENYLFGSDGSFKKINLD